MPKDGSVRRSRSTPASSRATSESDAWTDAFVPHFPAGQSPQFPHGKYALVPNAITCVVVLSGVTLMVASSIPHFRPEFSLVALMVGLLADVFDGLAARKLDAKSQFGSAFDQLADLTCFGVAPAIFFVRSQLDGKPGFAPHEIVSLIAGCCYAVCSVARIARELVVHNMSRPSFFVGIPTNLASFMLIPTVYLQRNAFWLPLFVFVLSFFMVSNIKIYKDLGLGWLIGWDFLKLRTEKKE